MAENPSSFFPELYEPFLMDLKPAFSKKKTHGDQWVTVEIEIRGSKSIKHMIDGKTVMEYTNPQLDDGTLLEGGTISLQSESHPVEFRKVELKRLGKSKK